MKQYKTYKDSGVEWIGDIPEHWKLTKIKNVTKIYGRIGFRGYTVQDIVEKDKGVISLSPSNIKNQKLDITKGTYISFDKYEESPEIKIFNNDVIFVKTASVGKVCFIENLSEPATLNPQLIVFKKIECNKKFLYYVLISEFLNYQIKRDLVGGVIPTLSQSVINNYYLNIPPQEEQTQIANYLNHKTEQLDSLISKKEQLIQLLQEERTAMINQAVTKGLDPNVPMKDSGIDWLGEIPAHWEVKKLKHVFKSKNSIRIPLSSEERGKMDSKIYDYYGASGVIDKVENYLFDEELILIGEDGANLLTRSKRLAFIASGKYWVNNHAHIIKPKKGNIYYLCELLEMLDYSIWVTGSAQPKLTQEALMSIQLFEPPNNEQDEIYEFIRAESDKINSIIEKSQQEIQLLKEYKTALISEVVTGKVDVRAKITI